MDHMTLKLLFASVILIITLIAGWYPFRKRVKSQKGFDFPIGESFATGIFLGAGLLHMLPESQTLFHTLNTDYPLAFVLAGATFLSFLWLEHLGREIYAHHQENHPAFALIALSMLSIHSILSGIAIGISEDYSILFMLFFAIISHKWAASFAIAVHLNKAKMKTRHRVYFFLCFSMMSPLGIMLGTLVGNEHYHETFYEAVFSALAAGTFLYLGTLHGLERGVMIKRCCNLRDFSFVIIGFAIMAILALYN